MVPSVSLQYSGWCYADNSSHEPRMRLKAFFGSLYRCLARGARAVLQLYAENMDQSEMITTYAMRASFAGGLVVDSPQVLRRFLPTILSSKARKVYLVLTCGPPSAQTSLPKGKGEDGETCSDDEDSGDDEDQTVGIYDRKKGKGGENGSLRKRNR